MRKFVCSAVLLFSCALFAQTSGKSGAIQSPTPKPPDAAAASLPAGAPTRELAEAYFSRMFGYDPTIQVKVTNIAVSPIPELYEVSILFVTPEGQQPGKWYVSKDLQHVIVGDLLPFGADPFAPVRSKLASSAFGASRGPANGKLLIVEFADLECPACRETAPLMNRLHDDFPNARFIFQSFPLAQIHPWAVRASSYLDCISRSNPDHAFTFIDAIFNHQREIEEEVRKTDANGKVSIDNAAVNAELRRYAEWAGADPAKTQTCAESSATAERIARSLQLGNAVNITGTPTIFINGRRIGMPSPGQYDALKTIVAFEADKAAEAK